MTIEEDELQHHVTAYVAHIFNGLQPKKLMEHHLLCTHLNMNPFYVNLQRAFFCSFSLSLSSNWSLNQVTYRPVFVIIISVPNSKNLSHSSFVSKWHCTGARSSQLHESVKRDFVCRNCEIKLKIKELIPIEICANTIAAKKNHEPNKINLPKSVRALIALHLMRMTVMPMTFERFSVCFALILSHCIVQHQHHHQHTDPLTMGLRFKTNCFNSIYSIWIKFSVVKSRKQFQQPNTWLNNFFFLTTPLWMRKSWKYQSNSNTSHSVDEEHLNRALQAINLNDCYGD